MARTFVLVHGGWCGAWVWRDVLNGLRKLGHGNTPFTERLAETGARADVRTTTIASDHFCMLSAPGETLKVLISS
jgi:hypothetical protein